METNNEQIIKVIPAERAVETKESVELEPTAKGQYKWTIKLKDEIITLETLKRLFEIDEALKSKYPNNVTNIQ